MNILEVKNPQKVSLTSSHNDTATTISVDVFEVENTGYSQGVYYDSKNEYEGQYQYWNSFEERINVNTKKNVNLPKEFSVYIKTNKATYNFEVANETEIETTKIILISGGEGDTLETLRLYTDNWVADIFTTTTTAVTEFAESVSTSVSAVGGMFYQGGKMTFLGTLSLLTAGTLLVMWAVRTIRRLIGR